MKTTSFISYHQNLLKQNWWVVLILFILVWMSYFNSLTNGLVSDDKGIADYNNFSIALKFESFLHSLINSTISQFAGTNPIPYRLFSVIFHFFNAVLVYLVITKLRGKKTALFTAVIFSVHPFLSEAVVWLSSSGYLLYSFFFLLSFYFYLWKEESKTYYYLSISFFLLTLMTFNRAAHLGVLFFVYELALGNLKTNWKKLIPYSLLTIIWGLLFMGLIPKRINEINQNNTTGSAFYNPLITIPFAFFTYLKLFIWPIGLSFYHSFINPDLLPTLLRLLVTIAFFVSLIYSYFKQRFFFFGLAFFFGSLLLFLTPLSIAWPAAERYAYLGSIGLIIVVAELLRILAQKKQFKYVTYGLLVTITLLLMVRTIFRNLDWKDESTVMRSVLTVYPNDARAKNVVANANFEKGDKETAKKQYEEAIRANPNLPEPFYNLGNYYREEKQYLEAIALYEKALEKDSNYWQAYLNMGNSYYFLGKPKAAIASLEEAIKISPKDASLYVNLGVFYQSVSDWQNAVVSFQKALVIDPNHTNAQAGLRQSQEKLTNP